MSNAIDNFWNEVAVAQIAAGGQPSVVTKEMRKVLDGDEEAAKQMATEIDIPKAKKEGREFLEHKNKEEGKI